MKSIISCDPGKSGALILWQDGRPTRIIDITTRKERTKKVINVTPIKEVVSQLMPDTFVIEKVGASPQMGPTSAFDFGYSFGSLVTIGECFAREVVTVTPQKWKTYQGVLNKPKDKARELAIVKFPSLAYDLRLKKHCDRADALLIGDTYLRLMEDGE